MAKKKPGFHVSLPKTAAFLAKTPKAKDVTVKMDKNGYYCSTHRARSKSYSSLVKIPKKEIESIERSG